MSDITKEELLAENGTLFARVRKAEERSEWLTVSVYFLFGLTCGLLAALMRERVDVL